jgi:hypothetical protein
MKNQFGAALILFFGILVSASVLFISWQELSIELKKSGIEYYKEIVKRVKPM